jgi:transposase
VNEASVKPLHPRVDGRRLSHETSLVIRRLAVRRVEAGERPSRVIASFGLCRTTIYRWLRAKRAGGFAALDRRRHPGRPPRISAERGATVREWLIGSTPSDYGLASKVWTRAAVAALLERRFGVELTPMSAGRLIRRIGLDARAATFVSHPRDLPGAEILLFAVDRRGAFLCTRLHGPLAADKVKRAMDDLTEHVGASLTFGWTYAL